MDNNEKQYYINKIISYGFTRVEAYDLIERPVNSEFTKEYFESEPFQKLLNSKKEIMERKQAQLKPKPQQPIQTRKIDYTRRSIERQTALNNAVEHSTPEKSTKDILIEAEEFYNWISKEV